MSRRADTFKVVSRSRRPPDPYRSSTEEHAFNDDAVSPLEVRIAETLWRWKFASESERNAIVADANLLPMIEHWFPFADIPLTRKLGTWCDGISTLEIASPSRLSFLLAGVGWFPTYLAPFELEFHFPRSRDTHAHCIILRLGFRGRLFNANDRHVPTTRDDAAAFARRPQRNQDWAVAVELTPNGG
ncbi:MAG: hypothetical protein AAGG48_30895 [Planctomycetota bacterium]